LQPLANLCKRFYQRETANHLQPLATTCKRFTHILQNHLQRTPDLGRGMQQGVEGDMIDTKELNKKIDLFVIAESATTLKRKGSSELCGPCPFCGGDDRFAIQPDRHRWLCRGCTDGGWKDGIEFVMRLSKLSLLEVAEKYGNGSVVIAEKASPAPKVAPKVVASLPPSSSWQWERLSELARAADYVWQDGEKGLKARAWFAGRGLSEKTVRDNMLGVVAVPTATLPTRGVTIPHIIDGDLWNVKTRTFDGGVKYRGLEGVMSKTLFNANHLVGKDIIIICEGEFDCLLLAQHSPSNVGVACSGAGASSLPDKAFWHYLVDASRILLVFDNDKAGTDGAKKWKGWLHWAEITRQTFKEKDITEFWQNGGDIGSWFERILD